MLANDEYIIECIHEHELTAITIFSTRMYDIATGAVMVLRHYVPEKELAPEIMTTLIEEGP